MNKVFTTRRLCRAGIIAALYTALTYVFAPFAYGPLQIRPAEALCILPLFYAEAVPALFVGCLLSNLLSVYSIFDIAFGSLATLLAAVGSYLVGVYIKKEGLKIFLGGLFPVLVNAIVIPVVIVFLCGDLGAQKTATAAYFTYVGSIFLSQTLWVYGGGVPFYFAIKRLQSRLPFFR
ncbi:MAG: QueT transporter family protein [Clostridia bacterium]|nr:QueT transporter family protein [Clostridia bacterium]